MKDDLISTAPRDVLFAMMLTECPEWLQNCSRVHWDPVKATPPCLIGKLSRKWLFNLPPGVWIVSGGGQSPIFAAEVAPGPFRRMQWEHIKILGADQKNVKVFACESDFKEHMHRRENKIGLSVHS